MKAEDRRVKRSRRLLGDALLNLLERQELGAITVRAVTEAADVGYMTFYRHYDHLDDLLVDRIRNLIEEQIDQVTFACDQQGSLIFNHIASYAALYRTLLSSPAATRARQKLEQMLAESFRLTVTDAPPVPVDLRARQMAAGLLSLAGWWLENGMTTPSERMAALYNHLIIEGHLDRGKMEALMASRE
jgi:AcrR family transcriptional regulator